MHEFNTLFQLLLKTGHTIDSNKPEIATIVFIYGGDEGSQVAVPVTNKILRYYFGIKDETDEEAPTETEQPFVELQPESTVTARLLGADSWSHHVASVSGFVLDEQGQGVGNVALEIVAGDEVVAQVVSGPTGQFDYEALDPIKAATWQLRLSDYSSTSLLQLDIATGMRYLVEFRASSTVNSP